MTSVNAFRVVPSSEFLTSSSMAVVAPFHDEKRSGEQICTRALKNFGAGCRWLYGLLDRLPGQCTVSKLDSFQRFQRETSLTRVAAILFLMPLPSLLINILIECIPLDDPATGFESSGYFQLRLFATAFIASLLPCLVKLNCVPESPVHSARTLVLLAISQALICLGTNAIIAIAADTFPVPLAQFTGIIPMTIVGRLIFYRHLPKDPQFHAQSNKVNLWVTVEILPVLIYPVFTVGFMSLAPTQQVWASFALPVLKIIIRRVLWLITKYDNDLTAVMICCVGHLYHILFTAMVLQNSKSLKTMGVVVMFGVFNMLQNCRYIVNDGSVLRDTKAKLESMEGKSLIDDNLYLALSISQEPLVARVLHTKVPSLLVSTYPGYREAEFLTRHEKVLKTVQVVPHFDSWIKISRIMPWSEVTKPTRQSSMRSVPVASDQSILTSSRSKSTPNAWMVSARPPNSNATRETFICNLASAMHQSEIILLRSWVSIYMTSFYVIYLVAVYWLPNRRYFATQAAMTSFEAVDNTVTRILLLCGMEMVFMGIYLVLIRRLFRVWGLYQLAFVLWSQRVLVQSKAIHLTVAILGFPLEHFGNDIILPTQPPE